MCFSLQHFKYLFKPVLHKSLYYKLYGAGKSFHVGETPANMPLPHKILWELQNTREKDQRRWSNDDLISLWISVVLMQSIFKNVSNRYKTPNHNHVILIIFFYLSPRLGNQISTSGVEKFLIFRQWTFSTDDIIVESIDFHCWEMERKANAWALWINCNSRRQIAVWRSQESNIPSLICPHFNACFL